jgi:hypothetical protein
MEPGVQNAPIDQLIDPLLAEQIADVAAADAGSYARE